MKLIVCLCSLVAAVVVVGCGTDTVEEEKIVAPAPPGDTRSTDTVELTE